jgi:hypothetical protein
MLLILTYTMTVFYLQTHSLNKLKELCFKSDHPFMSYCSCCSFVDGELRNLCMLIVVTNVTLCQLLKTVASGFLFLEFNVSLWRLLSIFCFQETFFPNTYGPKAISTVDESTVGKYFISCSLFIIIFSENSREVAEQTRSIGTSRRPSYWLLWMCSHSPLSCLQVCLFTAWFWDFIESCSDWNFPKSSGNEVIDFMVM